MNDNLKAILDAARLQRMLAHSKKTGMEETSIPFTPRAKKALAFAVKVAKVRMSGYVGTEHILFGLIQENDSLVATLLKSSGITLDDAKAIIEFQSETSSPEELRQPTPPESTPSEQAGPSGNPA